MRRSRLYTGATLGAMALTALAVIVLLVGTLGFFVKLATAFGVALPAPLSNLVKALPSVHASMVVSASTGTVSSVAVTA